LGKLAKLPRDETLQPLITKAVSVGVAFSPEKVMTREKLAMARTACHLTGLGPLTPRNPRLSSKFPRMVHMAAEMRREIVNGEPRIVGKTTYCFDRHSQAPRGKALYF
jgi:hypothetical protein